ncbi:MULTISPECIES: hypothetical protein [Burkholderiales]|uniref:Uncharacterized protein n=1 Tax=Cupriavidus basilensis TaxID=68895 RepID=A0A643FS27_9BURK|nr:MULTISPECIES: hypothetical protein [Burkholderiales]QOT82351.1 hypothetical protein F7R26_040305 [Cupriavidus basilensis]
MRTTVYARLFDRLADLIPSLQSAHAGAVFCAPPRIPDDMAVYCHIAAVEGDMRLIELADDNQKKGAVMPAPWLKLRVDMANKLAEVLEMEDTFGYQVIYTGGSAVNPRRAQINMFAMNWLQVMVNFELCFQPADVSVAA